MGRVAGVTSAETRERLLQAAAASFETRGYEGTRVADIAAAAGVSNGALYTHFASKGELLAEALRDHGSRTLAALFVDDPDRSVLHLLLALGRGLVDDQPGNGALVIEALVAARRDRDVAGLMGGHLAEREEWLADLVRTGQADGTFDIDLAPEVVSRFCLVMLLGARLLPAVGLDPVDPDGWSTLINRLGAALGPAPTRSRRNP